MAGGRGLSRPSHEGDRQGAGDADHNGTENGERGPHTVKTMCTVARQARVEDRTAYDQNQKPDVTRLRPSRDGPNQRKKSSVELKGRPINARLVSGRRPALALAL